MTDQVYTGDFFIEPGIIIKQEPYIQENITNAVPIPARRALDMSEIRDYTIDLDASNSPSMQEINSINTSQEIYSNGTVWGNRMDENMKSDFKMDDDDIFQVDKADLIQGPTLAELNANDDTLLEDLNFDDLLLPEEKSYYINISPNPSQLQLKFVAPQLNNNTNATNNNLFATSCPQVNLCTCFRCAVFNYKEFRKNNDRLNIYSFLK